jgi:protein-L-isoaspartate O-methyltransferase
LNDLIDAVNVARHWCSKNGFPKNPVTRRLRSQEFIEHRGVKLKNAHRSANDLCDFLMGIIATQKYKRILEIGTLFGFSTLHLAEAAALNNGRVTTIDLRVRKRTWVTGETVEDIHEVALKYADRKRSSPSRSSMGSASIWCSSTARTPSTWSFSTSSTP